MKTAHAPSLSSKLWKPALAVGIVAAILLLGAAASNMMGGIAANQQAFVLYTVTEADLPIVVTERGNLESQLETAIRCDVESSSFDRNTQGTQIIFIVPNGSAVNEGDLLVELDSAAIRNQLDSQQLAYDRAISQLIQAKAKYQNQLTQNETAEAEAALKVKLAELDLEMYKDDESGTFKLAMEDIERQIEEAKNTILESQAALELQKTEKAGIEALFKLGYRGRSDLDQSRYSYLQAEDKLARSVNLLINYQGNRKRLETYEQQMQLLSLNGVLATVQRNLEQVKIDNESKKEQANAAKIEAEKAEAKEKERLDKLTEQLELCKIYAPHSGMAVYARENSRYSSDAEIAEGVTVRQRQKILSLPDLSRMRVKTQVHEAVLDQVRVGLPVTVKIDAFPNRIYQGVVEQVAVVPSSSYYTTVKTYDCSIRIEELVEQLKPGMTAVVDIHVERLKNILAVPVQAIVQMDGSTWCYVQTEHGIERRDVELGRTNDKFVHVTKGLKSGEQIILNPMSIIKESESEKKEIAPDAGMGETPDIPPPPAADENGGGKAPGGAGKAGGAARPGSGGRPAGGRGGEGFGGSRGGGPGGGAAGPGAGGGAAGGGGGANRTRPSGAPSDASSANGGGPGAGGKGK